jgi:hypothetical protein
MPASHNRIAIIGSTRFYGILSKNPIDIYECAPVTLVEIKAGRVTSATFGMVLVEQEALTTELVDALQATDLRDRVVVIGSDQSQIRPHHLPENFDFTPVDLDGFAHSVMIQISVVLYGLWHNKVGRYLVAAEPEAEKAEGFDYARQEQRQSLLRLVNYPIAALSDVIADIDPARVSDIDQRFVEQLSGFLASNPPTGASDFSRSLREDIELCRSAIRRILAIALHVNSDSKNPTPNFPQFSDLENLQRKWLLPALLVLTVGSNQDSFDSDQKSGFDRKVSEAWIPDMRVIDRGAEVHLTFASSFTVGQKLQTISGFKKADEVKQIISEIIESYGGTVDFKRDRILVSFADS